MKAQRYCLRCHWRMRCQRPARTNRCRLPYRTPFLAALKIHVSNQGRRMLSIAPMPDRVQLFAATPRQCPMPDAVRSPVRCSLPTIALTLAEQLLESTLAPLESVLATASLSPSPNVHPRRSLTPRTRTFSAGPRGAAALRRHRARVRPAPGPLGRTRAR